MLIMDNVVVRWLITCNRPQEIHVSPLVKSLCSRAENITLLLNINNHGNKSKNILTYISQLSSM